MGSCKTGPVTVCDKSVGKVVVLRDDSFRSAYIVVFFFFE